MTRKHQARDLDQILSIWLAGSIQAHSFIEPALWTPKVNAMRDVYIPASETFVYESEGQFVGFYSLSEDNPATIFVKPDSQRKGLSSIVFGDAKARRESLQLTVYNSHSRINRAWENRFYSLPPTAETACVDLRSKTRKAEPNRLVSCFFESAINPSELCCSSSELRRSLKAYRLN